MLAGNNITGRTSVVGVLPQFAGLAPDGLSDKHLMMGEPAATYTSGLVRETDSGYEKIDDDQVIAMAIRILARRTVATTVLSNPRTTRDFLTPRLRRQKEALALVDIRVLDHLVIGGEAVDSFAERGLL